jgi:hypothetical protein
MGWQSLGNAICCLSCQIDQPRLQTIHIAHPGYPKQEISPRLPHA